MKRRVMDSSGTCREVGCRDSGLSRLDICAIADLTVATAQVGPFCVRGRGARDRLAAAGRSIPEGLGRSYAL